MTPKTSGGSPTRPYSPDAGPAPQGSRYSRDGETPPLQAQPLTRSDKSEHPLPSERGRILLSHDGEKVLL
jgi:hypothetical protein